MFACLARVSGEVSAKADARPHAPAQTAASAASAQAPAAAAADALTQLAADFSPRYERVHEDVVLIDVAGLGRVIGPPTEVGRELVRTAHARGMRLAVALAPTRTAATLLALHEAAAPSSASTVAPGTARTDRTARGAQRSVRGGGAVPVALPAAIVILPGEEARALAALPISLLARLPGDPHGVMAGLPGALSGGVSHGGAADAALPGAGATSGAGAGAASGKGSARGRGGARVSEQANGAYGKTRGKRSRGSGRNYRLAPAPGVTPAETIALLDTLRRWGLRTLGEILQLPAAELFERFGPASFWLRQVARGEDARPLVPTVAEDTFDAELALEWPLDNLEPLAFVISRLLDPLCARLEQRDRGAIVVHVALRLVTKTCETRRLELPAPMRDAKVLRTLILLDLESHPPGAGIDVVSLRFDVTPGRIVQHSLLTRALPSPEQLSTLIARLTAVMGEGRVGAPALIDSHRPEAFALRRFNPPAVAAALAGPLSGLLAGPLVDVGGRGGAAASREAGEGARPAGGTTSLRRFRRPLPVDVRMEGERPVHLSAARGVRGGRIVQAAGPWRSSGQWWQPAPASASASASAAKATATATRDEGSKTARVTTAGSTAGPAAGSTTGRTVASITAGIAAATAAAGAANAPGAFTRAWERDEWDIVLAGGELCRIYYDVARGRWLLESIID